MSQPYDLLIIGGGINGCSIARDAAGRGLSVCLCDQGDIAAATSSWSSKLIHGGIRYLENYEFKLVRESLQEREVLMESAPFLIHPLQFILPHESHLRPAWMIRAGLFLYDHLSKRKSIPGSKQLQLQKIPHNPLKPEFKTGFSYYDCQTDDSRLTLLNCLDAEKHGADIYTYTQCKNLIKEKELWRATLIHATDDPKKISAKAVINATGPWADQFNQNIAQVHTQPSLKLVQGSHIVVPKLYTGNHAYILQNHDKRIVFTIPFHSKFTLIGTTDTEFSGDPAMCQITPAETTYLLDIIKSYFKHTVSEKDIVWSYAGVRALYDNHTSTASSTTRDYHLELLDTENHPPYLTIFGGKLTTSRKLAEDSLTQLASYFAMMKAPWTSTAKFPGGQLESLAYTDYIKVAINKYAWLPPTLIQRYINAYGDRVEELLKGCSKVTDLGKLFGADLYEREVQFWQEKEHAQTIDDMLWRRSKFGLYLSAIEQDNLAQYLQ